MNYMKIAYEESLISFNNKEVPVGAIIVKNNVIIGKGHNTRQNEHDILGHAEINAIKEASDYIKDWRLSDCDMYVTLKPCSICTEIIKASRIKNVYYLIDKQSNKLEYNDTNITKKDDNQLSCEYLVKLNEFFTVNCNR